MVDTRLSFSAEIYYAIFTAKLIKLNVRSIFERRAWVYNLYIYCSNVYLKLIQYPNGFWPVNFSRNLFFAIFSLVFNL